MLSPNTFLPSSAECKMEKKRSANSSSWRENHPVKSFAFSDGFRRHRRYLKWLPAIAEGSSKNMQEVH